MIATPYFHPAVGGLEEYAYQLAVGLSDRGWTTHIVTSGAQQRTEYMGKLVVHRLPVHGHLYNTPVGIDWAWQLRRLIRTVKPCAINVHAPVPSMAIAVTRAVDDLPMILTYHAGSMHKDVMPADFLNRLYERWVLPWMMERSAAIVCSSTFVREGLLARWSDKSTTITPGVDTQLFTPSSIPANPNRIVAVGDFRDPRKGLEYLLAAMERLPSTELCVVGPSLPRTAPRVTFTGSQPRPAVARELQTSSALVLPSVSDAESFGMVLLEAMACGLPVIGSDIGGIPTIVNHEQNGLLVPPRDRDALAHAIARLTSDATLARSLGDSGRKMVVEHYTWTSRIDATEQILVQAAQRTGRSSVKPPGPRQASS
ncbi:MAG: glycosyltransferase family 4 protein [Solirubrobacteraceae bacterium]